MIFVVNSGSSSLKFKLFDRRLRPVASGMLERIGLDTPFVALSFKGKRTREEFMRVKDHAEGLARVFSLLKDVGIHFDGVQAVGHRVVHGGTAFVRPMRIDARAIVELKKLSKLAPLHNPANVSGIEAARALLPGVPNVAVFDTAFYRDLPAEAYMYALPYELYQKHGLRKYGFHGISHEYVASEAARRLKKPLSKLKLVTCHLGSGASVTAVSRGKAIDTSMGFTPLEGLTMSTRCGDIDPEIPLWMIRELGMTPDEVDETLNEKSGILGISGYKDMRDVQAAAARGEKRARLAIDMFVYDVVRYVGQFMAALGGCDAVVFTAGIGERSGAVRKKILKRLAPLRLKALVVPTDEEGMIARQAAALLRLK